MEHYTKSITILLLITLSILSYQTIKAGEEENLSLIKTSYEKEDGTKINFYIIKINPSEYKIEIYYGNNKGIKIDDIKKDSEILAAINCGFFQEPFLPVGLLISKGEKINDLDSYWEHTGVFYITTDQVDPYGICTKDAFYDTDVTEGVQSFPLLVWYGKPYVRYNDSEIAARSAIATDDRGNILLIATDTGITLYEFSRALCKMDWNCRKALNLDGGSSTQMYFKGKLSFYPATGFFQDNRVSNFLTVKKK